MAIQKISPDDLWFTLVFPQPGGPVINQVFCMARRLQAWSTQGLRARIILTMPDQMTPVIESSVEFAKTCFAGNG